MSYFNGRIEFETMKEAASGNSDSINKIVDFYSDYIRHLLRRKMEDSFGRCHYFVDESMYRRLETKFITTILAFKKYL